MSKILEMKRVRNFDAEANDVLKIFNSPEYQAHLAAERDKKESMAVAAKLRREKQRSEDTLPWKILSCTLAFVIIVSMVNIVSHAV